MKRAMKKSDLDSKGRYRGDTPLGREILSSLHDLQNTLEAGIPLAEKYTVRTVAVPEPSKYGPKEVRALRTQLGLSQAVFAQLLGASVILIQKWEGGDRRPDGMARRLLDDIKREPRRWARMIRPVERRPHAA